MIPSLREIGHKQIHELGWQTKMSFPRRSMCLQGVQRLVHTECDHGSRLFIVSLDTASAFERRSVWDVKTLVQVGSVRTV